MSLESRNLRNLVHVYQDELTEILSGRRPSTFLTPWARRQLTRKGLLTLVTEGGRRLRVTPEAQQILQEVAP